MDERMPNHETVGGWETMGGSVGDGSINNLAYSQTPPNPSTQLYANAGPVAIQQFPSSQGSITRFASPESQQPQPHQQVYSGQAAIPHTPGSSYAARSQQAFGQIQQVQHFPHSQPHQQLPVQTHLYPQAHPPSQGNASNMAIAGNSPSVSSMSPATQNFQSTITTQQITTGSYAVRSAQALYGTTPHQPQVVSSNSNGTQQNINVQQQAYGMQQQAYGMQPQYNSQQQPIAQQPIAQQPIAQQPIAQQQYNSQQLYHSQQQNYGQTQQTLLQQQQQQQQQTYGQHPSAQPVFNTYGGANTVATKPHESPQVLAMQQRILTESTKKIQEHAYYMKQAMEQNNLSVVLDRAAHMVGELGGPPHGQQHYQQQQLQQQQQNNNINPNAGLINSGGASKLTPKNYYDLYMRALEELPTFEDYLMNLTGAGNTTNMMLPDDHIRIVDTATPQIERKKYTMRELYDFVQYCPRVVSRLYLQIAAGSALIRSGECGAKFVLQDLRDAVKCEQNPIRGLFVRHYLITALKDKLPTSPPPAPEVASEIRNEEESETPNSVSDVPIELETGTVKDSYEFILSNFMEMNKLWVRIQNLPGEGKNKDVRKRRERERNDLRILVGTNLVRLSQLESVTSKIYGEVILPQILEHIVVAGDPLSQAYLMDCLVQVFPDEYHIETLPILLNVCPRLRDKVNIRTILQGLMDRLANYLADEELLDETDTNEVKKTLARDSFGMFEECVSTVYNARGPKLTSREVIRLQTALLQFSTKCFPGNLEQISSCVSACLSALRQASADYEFHDGTVVEVPQEKIVMKPLDDVSVVELEKLLSIPLSTLAIKVLQFEDYSGLISFLPWANRREIAIKMLKAAVEISESVPSTVPEVIQLFSVIEPLLRDERTESPESQHFQNPAAAVTLQMAGLGFNPAGQTNHLVQLPEHGVANSRIYAPDQLRKIREENALVCKLLHLLSEKEDLNVVYEMLVITRNRIASSSGGPQRVGQTLGALVFASVRLCCRVFNERQVKDSCQTELSDQKNDPNGTAIQKVESSEIAANQAIEGDIASDDCLEPAKTDETVGNEITLTPTDTLLVENADASSGVPDATKDPGHLEAIETLTEVPPILGDADCVRKIFVFIQEAVLEISKFTAERSFKIYLEVAMVADSFVGQDGVSRQAECQDYSTICTEFLSQAFSIFDEKISDSKVRFRCIVSIVGTLLALKSLSCEQYEKFITKTAQYSAKMTKKHEQCQLVALCAYLFYPVQSEGVGVKYSNPQRALECLQRCLKLADACATANPAHVTLFVDLLEHYVFFFEKGNPAVSHAYISGLVALIKEHLNSLVGTESLSEAKAHFQEIIRYILRKKVETDSSQLFASVNLG